MPLTPTYSVGTVAVSAGGSIVTGAGTQWLAAGIRAGDVFENAGLTASVASVESNTSLTLVRGWPGIALTAAPYEIRYTSDATRVLASARQVVDLLDGGNLSAIADLDSTANVVPYFTGPGVAGLTALSPLGREMLAETTPQGVRAALGLEGYAGAGIRVLGAFSNMAGLPTTGNVVGDAYIVGGTSIQIWTGALPWANAGLVVGPAGLDGVQIYSSRSAAAAGAPGLSPSAAAMMNRNGTAMEFRQRNATVDDPLFASGDRWGVIARFDPTPVFQQMTAIGGTANAITGTLPVGTPLASLVAGSRLSFAPTATNTGNVTLMGVQVRDMDGNQLPAGYLKPGRAYLVERQVTNLFRVVSEPFGAADATSLVNARIGTLDADVAAATAGLAAKADLSQVTVLTEPSPRADGSFALITGGTNDGTADLMRVYPGGLSFQREGGDPGGLTADGWAVAEGSFTAQAGQHGMMAVDRFTDRAGGVRLPVAVVDGETRKAVIVSVYGQSLGDVTPMADPLVWDTPPFPHHAFMLDDMNDISSGNLRGGMLGWQGVAVQRGSRMINASEALRRTQSYASAAFARLIAWDGPLRRVGLIRSSAWGGNRLIGNAADTGIWKGSTGAYTQSWANWTGDIQQSRDLLTAAGYEVEAVYICFSHQEADWQTARADYLSQFLGMKAEREALIAAAMPGVDVHWFCDQASGSGYRTGSYLGGKWPSRLAIVDACRPENGGSNITMVTPRYWFPTGNEFGVTGNPSQIHHTHEIRPIWGELFGHAMRARELGKPWRCPVMSSASVVGNSVVVNFDSILPLVIDQTFAKVRPDMGFTVDEGATVVTGVAQTGQRQITVTCATTPTTSVEYAWREQDAADAAGAAEGWPIATGAIRDGWSEPSLFDPNGRPMPRAAVGYQLSL